MAEIQAIVADHAPEFVQAMQTIMVENSDFPEQHRIENCLAQFTKPDGSPLIKRLFLNKAVYEYWGHVLIDQNGKEFKIKFSYHGYDDFGYMNNVARKIMQHVDAALGTDYASQYVKVSPEKQKMYTVRVAPPSHGVSSFSDFETVSMDNDKSPPKKIIPQNLPTNAVEKQSDSNLNETLATMQKMLETLAAQNAELKKENQALAEIPKFEKPQFPEGFETEAMDPEASEEVHSVNQESIQLFKEDAVELLEKIKFDPEAKPTRAKKTKVEKEVEVLVKKINTPKKAAVKKAPAKKVIAKVPNKTTVKAKPVKQS